MTQSNDRNAASALRVGVRLKNDNLRFQRLRKTSKDVRQFAVYPMQTLLIVLRYLTGKGQHHPNVARLSESYPPARWQHQIQPAPL